MVMFCWPLQHQLFAKMKIIVITQYVHQIQKQFLEYTQRKDNAVTLMSQSVANMIRRVVDDFARSGQVAPAVLEMPSKDVPYDPKKDPIMQRVQMSFGSNPVM